MNTLTTGHVTFSLHPEHMGLSYSGVLDLLGACDLVDLSQIASSYYGYSRVEVRFISPGGLTSGMNTVASVFDALRKRGVTVATSAFGLTASAAAVLLSYGDLGERRVQAGTTLLYHHPRVEAEVVTSSSARDLQAQLAAAGRDGEVDGRIVDHLGDADRHLRPEEVRTLGARLEQQDAMLAALGQPARDDRARGFHLLLRALTRRVVVAQRRRQHALELAARDNVKTAAGFGKQLQNSQRGVGFHRVADLRIAAGKTLLVGRQRRQQKLHRIERILPPRHIGAQDDFRRFGLRQTAVRIDAMRHHPIVHACLHRLIPGTASAMPIRKRNPSMAPTLTPHQTFLAPLAKLALRHPMLEGQAIWWEAGDWQAQDDEEAMIDGEEIAYYAEGLLAEGFGLHWQVLAEADAPKEPVLVLLFLWQSGEAPDLPEPGPDWVVLAQAETPAA